MGSRVPNTAAERIALAIGRSGKTLEEIAEKIGCTHTALSYWRSGKTDPDGIKVGLLQRFADETGVELRWLVKGEGPMISRYVLSSEMDRISVAIHAMERSAPQQIETVVRMVEAAAKTAK